MRAQLVLGSHALFVALLGVASGCGDDESPAPTPTVARPVFALGADLANPDHFYDLPFPSDLRLTATGAPDVTGFPRSELATILDGLLEIAGERPGWSMNPVTYFEFTHDVGTALTPQTVFDDLAAPVMLVDVDPDSDRRGELLPVVARALPPDAFVRTPLLAVAPRPGIVLWPDRTYAVVVTKRLAEHSDLPIEGAEGFDAVRPGGGAGSEVADLYAPMWETLESLGVPAEDVLVATVLTTGDVVRETFELSEAVLAAHDVTIDGLVLDPDDGDHERYCELLATVRYPQFQKGAQPFEVDGKLVLDASGAPVKQGEMEVPVVLAIPKTPMPADGYPLMMYFHGSGGVSNTVVDRAGAEGPATKGLGPAHEVAAFGIASAGSALPVNPERLKGADDLAYINFDNPKAFPSTFRQGVFEQRLFIEALSTLEIPPDVLAACPGPTLPVGGTAFRFSEERLTAMGQSMGGMYTNLITAVEPRIEAAVPTGAGGYWSFMVFNTALVPGAGVLLGLLIDTKQSLDFFHPALAMLQLTWEAGEPMVYMPRLARRPLAGHPVRPIFQPAGTEDTYFATDVYDAAALAYGHQEAGEEVWSTMQEALALAGLDGIASYAVSQNRTSEIGGEPYTSVIAQYSGADVSDGHYIAFEIDGIKHQYGCFLSSFVESGIGVVPAPDALGAPCE